VHELVDGMVGALVDDGFRLVDPSTGKPTSWGKWDTHWLNEVRDWSDNRGLRALEMLSYLAAAEEVTGDGRYKKAADMLRTEHGYGRMMVNAKITVPCDDNHSDDEEAFLVRQDRLPPPRQALAPLHALIADRHLQHAVHLNANLARALSLSLSLSLSLCVCVCVSLCLSVSVSVSVSVSLSLSLSLSHTHTHTRARARTPFPAGSLSQHGRLCYHIDPSSLPLTMGSVALHCMD
jgi:hypothetical protein